MGLFDLPQIDRYSKNSNSSIIAVLSSFCEDNGFICRTDVPDKGCDFDIELIIDGKAAINWRFGLQLKSEEQIKPIAGGTFLSYSFETSRLGYLLRRPLGAGLIVIFDVANKVSYYEFPDRIYTRLLEARDTEDWMAQEKVNIHIPAKQVLTSDHVKVIHDEFVNRFRNGEIMQASHGGKYNLPTIRLSEKTHYDLHNKEDVKLMLMNHGFALQYEMDTQMLYELVSRLSPADIGQDKTLLLFAGTVYSEVGKVLESELYLSKLRKRNDLDIDEVQTISFSHLKNQLVSGAIDIKAFIEQAKLVREKTRQPHQNLTLEINIIYFEILSLKFYHEIPKDMSASIRDIFDKITRSGLPARHKALLEIWNAENFSQLITYHRQKQLNDFAAQKIFRKNYISAEKEDEYRELISLQLQFTTGLDRLNKLAVEASDELLQAHIMYLRARYIVLREMDYYIFLGTIPESGKDNQAQFKSYVDLAFNASDIFADNNLFSLAHECLGKGLELIFVGRNFYHFDDDYDLKYLEEVQAQQEKEWELEPYEPIIPKLIERIETERKINLERPLYMVKNFDDTQIKGMADTIYSFIGRGETTRLEVVRVLNAFRSFYQRCTDTEVELLQVSATGQISKGHIMPHARFVLHHKKTGVRSLPEYDISCLLTSWGFE